MNQNTSKSEKILNCSSIIAFSETENQKMTIFNSIGGDCFIKIKFKSQVKTLFHFLNRYILYSQASITQFTEFIRKIMRINLKWNLNQTGSNSNFWKLPLSRSFVLILSFLRSSKHANNEAISFHYVKISEHTNKLTIFRSNLFEKQNPNSPNDCNQKYTSDKTRFFFF